jgi:hypothetical protein
MMTCSAVSGWKERDKLSHFCHVSPASLMDHCYVIAEMVQWFIHSSSSLSVSSSTESSLCSDSNSTSLFSSDVELESFFNLPDY